MTVDIRPAADRFATKIDWLDSKHSFSFGHHYDPANTHHGVLLVNNDDVVAPGTGFETHPHRDMEIVTWVLRGQLVHQDSQGHNGVIYPGLAQRMSAGTGILHSEKNDAWRITGDTQHDEPVHFVQMWVVPDEQGISPGYEQLEIGDELLRGGLVPVASGMAKHDGASAIRISTSRDGDLLRVEVTDDGKGFDPREESTAARSTGLRGVRERAELIGSRLQIDSARGRGTTVRIEAGSW